MIGAITVAVACLSPALAQPNETMGSGMATSASHPLKVSKCSPQMNTNNYVGYAAGYYPAAGPYGWYDVYGYRYIQPVNTGSAHLGIDYTNVTDKVMSSIEFGLIARGALVAEAKDVGTFSPGVEIKHEFGLNPNVFPLGTALPACVPLRIKFQDGTTWKNPHLPALERSIYQ
jgi:hypothetical protein